MSKHDELVKALREYSGCRKGEIARITSDAAAAIEALQAEVKDLNEALKVESKARENAEAKRYCCNCAHMDASMYDEAWYGICKLNDFEVEAIHGWGCTDWAKMFASDTNVLNKNDTTDGPIITPCRGCSDYDGYGGCKSKGGCAMAVMEVQDGQ